MTFLTAFVLLCFSVALHLIKHLSLMVIAHIRQARLANLEEWIDWNGVHHAHRRHSYRKARRNWLSLGS